MKLFLITADKKAVAVIVAESTGKARALFSGCPKPADSAVIRCNEIRLTGKDVPRVLMTTC